MTLSLLATIGAIGLFAGAMVLAAVMDVLTLKVSDRLVLLLAAGYAVLAPVAGWSLNDIAWSVSAAMLVFFASVAFFSLGWMGGGDGKLATVSTLWVGAQSALPFVATTALLGGVCALGLLLVKNLALPRSWLRKPWLARLHAAETGVPYAVAIGLAALLQLPNTLWIATLP